MHDDIIIYQKLVYGFEIVFERYKKQYYDYVSGLMNKEEYADFISIIRNVFGSYNKYLKYYYRCKGIELNCPKEIITKASNDGLINDAECWLKFIEACNVLYIKYSNSNEQFLSQIVKNFYDKPFLILEYMHSQDKIDFVEKIEPTMQKYYDRDIQLDNSKTTYSPDIIGMSPRSYNLLINYFKSNKNIKNVWLHGSRLLRTNLNGADIDVIIDCPIKEYENIQREIAELTIPYYVDTKCLNADYSQRPIKLIMNMNPRKIYCAFDYQVYW